VNRKEDSTVLMLTTIGRRSGQERSVLVNHVRDDEDFIVVGSNWGYEQPPAWRLNLQAYPQAKGTVAQIEHDVVAEFPEGSEQARCWDLFTETFRNWTTLPRAPIAISPLYSWYAPSCRASSPAVHNRYLGLRSRRGSLGVGFAPASPTG
jgi:deazaflavin-dependent oxidoreductase (nitroreductase family)